MERAARRRPRAPISPRSQPSSLGSRATGGHALVALKTEAAMPIHKATIVPRGDTLGMVAYLPEKDQMNLSKDQMLAHLDICMGGRVAEELIFGRGKVTTGAGSDLQQATSMARNMVAKYGMSETLGPIFLSDRELEKLSPATREQLEAEVKALLQKAEANAMRILKENRKELERLAQGLLAHETLDRKEIDLVLAGKKLPAALKPQAAG